MTINKLLTFIGLSVGIGFCTDISISQEVFSVQGYKKAANKRSVEIRREENMALDLVLLDLLKNKGNFYDYPGHKLVFHGSAWSSYNTHQPLIIIGDLSRIKKQIDLNNPYMDEPTKLILSHSNYKKAFLQLYPDCIGYINSCSISHDDMKILIALNFGPSPHGAMANYIVTKVGKNLQITYRCISLAS